jgi:hypothetical protein
MKPPVARRRRPRLVRALRASVEFPLHDCVPLGSPAGDRAPTGCRSGQGLPRDDQACPCLGVGQQLGQGRGGGSRHQLPARLRKQRTQQPRPGGRVDLKVTTVTMDLPTRAGGSAARRRWHTAAPVRPAKPSAWRCCRGLHQPPPVLRRLPDARRTRPRSSAAGCQPTCATIVRDRIGCAGWRTRPPDRSPMTRPTTHDEGTRRW